MKPALLLALSAGLLQAQSFSLNQIYICDSGRTKLKVVGCSGDKDTDLCGVQHLNAAGIAEISARTSEYRSALTQRLQSCQRQPKTPPPAAVVKTHEPVAPGAGASGQAQTARPPVTQPQPARLPVQTVGIGGFKVGDTVEVNTLFGWADGKIMQVRGNSYQVQAVTGAIVWKDYPAELRRKGALTAADKAAGQYELHDRVQVLFEGKWVESEIIGSVNNEFQVKLPGNRAGWTTAQNLRYLGPQEKPPAPKAGVPPQPGLTSCAGKIEGRYSSSIGGGLSSITFRSGKATISSIGGTDELECWTGGSKIYLRDPKTGESLPIDINNDGTLDTPMMGELKKKGN